MTQKKKEHSFRAEKTDPSALTNGNNFPWDSRLTEEEDSNANEDNEKGFLDYNLNNKHKKCVTFEGREIDSGTVNALIYCDLQFKIE